MKKRQYSFHIVKAFSFLCNTNQGMKTSDGDLKVNQNIYQDVVTCDRMPLIRPKSCQLGPINHCLLEEL